MGTMQITDEQRAKVREIIGKGLVKGEFADIVLDAYLAEGRA